MCVRVVFAQNTDASLLPTISWPAFAIHEDALISKTTSKVIRKLAGRAACMLATSTLRQVVRLACSIPAASAGSAACMLATSGLKQVVHLACSLPSASSR